MKKVVALVVLLVVVVVAVSNWSSIEQLFHPNCVKIGDTWINYNDPDYRTKVVEAELRLAMSNTRVCFNCDEVFSNPEHKCPKCGQVR